MNYVEPIVDKPQAERRVVPRVRVDLPGRVFFPVEGREALCTVVDLSPVGTWLQCDEGPEPDTQVILYLGPFGRFAGTCNAMRQPQFRRALRLHRDETRAHRGATHPVRQR